MERSTEEEKVKCSYSDMFLKTMDDDPDTLQYVSRKFKDPVKHLKSIADRLNGHPGGYLESVFYYIGNDLSQHDNKHSKYIMEMYYDLRFLKNVLQELGMIESDTSTVLPMSQYVKLTLKVAAPSVERKEIKDD